MHLNCISQDHFRDTPLDHIWQAQIRAQIHAQIQPNTAKYNVYAFSKHRQKHLTHPACELYILPTHGGSHCTVGRDQFPLSIKPTPLHIGLIL